MLAAVKRRKQVLSDAEVLVEHPAPDSVHDRNRKDIGQKKRCEHDALHPALEAVDAERDDQRKQNAGRHRQDHEVDRVPDRRRKQPVRGEPEIIVEPYPLARPDQRSVGEAELHHLDGRIDEEYRVDDDERRHQNGRGQRFAARAFDHRDDEPRSPRPAPARRQTGPERVASGH